MEMGEIISKKGLSLGVPIESRVKDWASIVEKIDRKSLNIKSVRDLDDLIGVRVILLFRSDLHQVDEAITQTFHVLGSEDTGDRLGSSQFGYQSRHYIIQLPPGWLGVPSMAALGDLRVELQVRTLAQHIWAAASHKLQYKHENSVPEPLLRSISRVAALLETVDLEFIRVLDERSEYQQRSVNDKSEAEPINVDLVGSVLDEVFPRENKKEIESLDSLIADIKGLGIESIGEFRKIMNENKDYALQKERETVASRIAESTEEERSPRLRKGVFYAHVGLARQALKKHFNVQSLTAAKQELAAKQERTRNRKK